MNFRQFLEAEGIITAQNPEGHKASPEANTKANRRLCKDIQYLHPRKIHGTYNGNEEEAFKIPKIGKRELLKLGRKYQQKAVVWGGKSLNP